MYTEGGERHEGGKDSVTSHNIPNLESNRDEKNTKFGRGHKRRPAKRHIEKPRPQPLSSEPDSTKSTSNAEEITENEPTPVTKSEHFEKAVREAMRAALGLTIEGFITADDIKDRFRKSPEAFKFEYLEDILEGNKSDILNQQRVPDEEQRGKKVLRDFAEVATEYFKKFPRIKNDKELYGVRRPDGTWAIHTRSPDDDRAYIPFSKDTLAVLRRSLSLENDQVKTLDAVKEGVVAMKNGKRIGDDERELVLGYIESMIGDLTNLKDMNVKSSIRKGDIDKYIWLLDSYGTLAENYKGKSVKSRISKLRLRKNKP